MKKRLYLLFGILAVLAFTGIVFAVVNFFDSQSPSDINVFNLFGTGQSVPLNISYNISDTNLVFSTIRLYYKVNSSINDNVFFRNGSYFESGWKTKNYYSPVY